MAERNSNLDSDLWNGYGLKTTNWPDIEKALQIVQDELSDGLAKQQLWQIKRAHRWLKSVEQVLADNITSAERI